MVTEYTKNVCNFNAARELCRESKCTKVEATEANAEKRKLHPKISHMP
jgi:hypothetical protein